MSQKGIEQLIGRALASQGFLEEFLKNPKGKAREEGLDISAEEFAEIRKMDAANVRHFAEAFAKEFGDRQQKMGVPFL